MRAALRLWAARLAVRARSRRNRFVGGDDSGLTVPCKGGCGDDSPHDAHLAFGALRYLGGYRRRP